MLLEMPSLGRRHLDSKVLTQGSVVLTGQGLTSTGRARWVDQGSMSSAGGSQKKRKAVVRKESAETHDYTSCQDTEVDNDKSLEEMDFLPSAVSESVGWHEPLRVMYISTRGAMKRTSHMLQFFMMLHPFWLKMTASRTRFTSVDTVTASDGQKEANQR